MDEIKLIVPTIEYAADIAEFKKELETAEDSDMFAGCGNLRDCTTAEEWLASVAALSKEETCPVGYVTSDTYLAVRVTDNRIVGVIDLRHHINHPVLGLWGGHMGYSVRPSERRKGYAKEMLRLNLENCRRLGLDKIMITCNRNNIASEKTILANGGVFEKEVFLDAECIKRYWISL